MLTVTPTSFVLVRYDHAEIVDLATKVVDRTGFPVDRDLLVEVDESTPLQRVTVRAIDPVTIEVEGGAFEDPTRPRQLSVPITEAVLSKVLFRVADRLDGSFADAPVDAALSHAQLSAWNVYAVGRSTRAGFFGQQQRQRYGFRNRHRFSDAADAVFDRLWAAENLTWSELAALSAQAAS